MLTTKKVSHIKLYFAYGLPNNSHLRRIIFQFCYIISSMCRMFLHKSGCDFRTFVRNNFAHCSELFAHMRNYFPRWGEGQQGEEYRFFDLISCAG